MKGQIVKINSDLHFVSYNNNIYPCKCRGLFRKEHIIPVVGDYVLFSSDKLLIEDVLPRKNIFNRPKVSNIDQAFYLLDKFISLMEINNVRPIICITKSDLVDEDELNTINNVFNYYSGIGYTVIYNYELDKIKELIKDKTSVFTGQTGAGKSTLLNKLNPDWNLDVGEVSVALGRGKHTTRVVELFELYDGYVMDTPGFSSLELSNYTKEQIRDSFIEFKKYPCIYKDCMHTKESECIVKENVKNNNILKSRYINYLNFIGEEENES